MSTDANRANPGPKAYMILTVKKLWFFPTLAFALAVLGDILNYNENWNIVTALVSLAGVAAVGRLTGSKRTADGSHLANGNRIFLFLSLVQAAMMTASFLTGSYISAALLFMTVVWFSAMFLWGCDATLRTQARKTAGDS